MSSKKKKSSSQGQDATEVKENSQAPVMQHPVPVAFNACPKCGSTARGPITCSRRRDVGGTFRGQIYDYQIRKWTSCTQCGQRRVIIEHHRKTRN